MSENDIQSKENARANLKNTKTNNNLNSNDIKTSSNTNKNVHIKNNYIALKIFSLLCMYVKKKRTVYNERLTIFSEVIYNKKSRIHSFKYEVNTSLNQTPSRNNVQDCTQRGATLLHNWHHKVSSSIKVHHKQTTLSNMKTILACNPRHK